MSGQSILFDIIARDKASSTFNKVGDSAARSESHLKRFGETAKVLAGVAGAAVIGGGLTDFLKDSISEGREAQKVGALTTQVIKSTGGAAHVTAQQVGDLANAISKKVGVDDEAIQSGANMLLTFKNVRNEAGKGNDVFNQAVQATTDMAAAMAAASGGQLDLRSASIRLGKALNDPVKGMTALAKVGVTFTDKQKAVNKALVEGGVINAINAYTGATGSAAITSARFAKIQKDQHLTFDQTVKMLTGPMSAAQQQWFRHLQEGNHTAEAQRRILKELKSEFGGAAASQATESDKARVAVKNLEEQVGTALLPTVDKLARFVTNDAVPAISKFVTGMQDGTGAGGEFAKDLRQVYDAGKSVIDFLNGVPGPVKKYGAEIAVAAVMLNRLNNGLTSSRTGLRGFVNGLGPAERGMTRTQVAAYNLGQTMRNVAGAGGMLAMVDGAKRGDSALGALEVTAGAAAAGFAVGGPLGAGIGAAAGGLFSLYKAATDTGGAFKQTLPTMKQYVDTLDGVGAAAGRATRAMVLERLEKSGLLKQTEALGISDRDAVQAAMGNEAARKRVSAALADATAKGKNYQALNIANKLGAETTAINSSRVAQLQKNLALAATKQEAQRIQNKLDRLGRTNANPTITIGGYAKAARQLNSVLQMMKDVTGTKGGITPPPSGGGFGALLGAAHRAMGGPVLAGQPYIVGEKRPELFVPNQSGRIVPRVSAPGPQFHIENVYVQDMNDFLRQAQARARLSSLDGVRRQ